MSEPLGQSQVVPYVLGLARAGWEMRIVAFEPETAPDEEIAEVSRRLAAAHVRYTWFRRRASHRTGVKAAEIATAVMKTVGQGLSWRPTIVHARSYFAASVARITAASLPGARFLFDVRGLLGEEYVDAGHWTAQSFKYRALKLIERDFFARAAAVVVLTERHLRWLHDESRLLDPLVPAEVVPCCVDLAKFTAGDDERAMTRRELGAGDRFVLAYAGTLGASYPVHKMAAFFAALRRRRPALFAVYSHSPTEALAAALEREGVASSDVVYRRVHPPQMARYLAAADAGLHFMTPCFSRIGCSPTKVPEYLAMGLPVVMNQGIGDSDTLIARVPAVVDAGKLLPDELERAAERLATLDRGAVSDEARRVAREQFSTERGLARYLRLYERLAGGSPAAPGTS